MFSLFYFLFVKINMKSFLNYTEVLDLNGVNDSPFLNPKFRRPTVNNPMMNPTIPEFDTNQNKDTIKYYANPQNKNYTGIGNQIEFDMSSNLFKDPAGFFWNKDNNMRQWFSVPGSTVPNGQTEFAEYLYGKDLVCKSGSIWAKYDVPYTADSLACTGFDKGGSMTNFGRI
jgi:hypothetical protein